MYIMSKNRAVNLNALASVYIHKAPDTVVNSVELHTTDGLTTTIRSDQPYRICADEDAVAMIRAALEDKP